MKYFLWIIGCQYNEWDGARIKYILDQLGFSESKKPDNADFIVILACSVRQTAIDRIFGRIKNWPDKKIYIGGCVLENDKKKFTEKGIGLFDSNELSSLTRLLPKIQRSNNVTIEQLANRTNYIPIMTGCNNFCSYCAVPYTRGREKSRPHDNVIQDVKELIDRGEKEITLLGQNVNSYKIDQKSKVKSQNCNSKIKTNESDFAKLLHDLNDLPGNFSISFMSNHPKDMSDDIIEAVATLPKIKKEIHLPLQSGSNKILKAMNRPYTADEYLRLVKNIKSKIKDVKITTDVIVGFPGETEDDFNYTVKVFKKVGFVLAYINKYSPRSGTAAFQLGDPIPWREKQRRWRMLNDIANNNQ